MKRVAAIGVALMAATASVAHADGGSTANCTLQLVTSLDTETLPSGEIAVPVTLNDTRALFEVDTGSIYSSMSEEAAAEQGARAKYTPYLGSFVNNVSTNSFATLNSFALGNLRTPGKRSVVIAPDQLLPESVSGLLGPDIMGQFDAEFDFYRGKLNFFVHKTCPGAVYWTHDPSDAMPMKADSTGHIVVDATLDGKPVTILLDTGSPSSLMSLDAAEKLFGFTKDDPRLKYMRTVSMNGGSDTPFYSFPFSSLTFGAITVANPKIQLIPQGNYNPRGRPDADIILGMSVLRQLHLYVAYDEKMLYLSAAEAH